MNTNATTSRKLDPNDLHDHYIPGVASTFPQEEDYGFQHLLATQGYASVAGDNYDEEHDINDQVERDGRNVRSLENEDCLQSNNGSTSSPNNVCIKRKSFDTEIDPLTRKRQLSLYGTTQ